MGVDVLIRLGINAEEFRQSLQELQGGLAQLASNLQGSLQMGDGLNQLAEVQDRLREILGEDFEGFSRLFNTDDVAEFGEALNQMLTTLESEGVEGVEQIRKEFKGLAEDLVRLGAEGFTPLERGAQSVVSNIQSAFTSFVRTGEIDFERLANSIVTSLSDIAFDEFIKEPLEQIFNDLLSSLTSGLANLGTGSGGGGFLSSIFSSVLGFLGFGGGGKALGGSVSGGRPYVVGEQGRELFVPETSGRIVPNHALGGGNIIFNVQATDAQSFQRSETQIAAMLNRMVSRGNRNL